MSPADVQVRENLASLSRTFETYWKLTRKTRKDALAHTGRNFSFYAVQRLRGIQIKKGAIRSERLAAFKAGEGIQISDRARQLVFAKYGAVTSVKTRQTFLVGRGKKGFTKAQRETIQALNKATGGRITLQSLLAEKEIELRESHRGFTTISTRFRGNLSTVTQSKRKSGETSGQARPVDKGLEGDEMHFDWNSQIGKYAAMAATGLGKQKAKAAMALALGDTRQNMLVYIQRKQQEAARNAARTINRL